MAVKDPLKCLSVMSMVSAWVSTITVKIMQNTEDISVRAIHTERQCGVQGSHSSWKTWKNGDSFSSLEKSWNFVIFAKYPGKMRQTLEI